MISKTRRWHWKRLFSVPSIEQIHRHHESGNQRLVGPIASALNPLPPSGAGCTAAPPRAISGESVFTADGCDVGSAPTGTRHLQQPLPSLASATPAELTPGGATSSNPSGASVLAPLQIDHAVAAGSRQLIDFKHVLQRIRLPHRSQ